MISTLEENAPENPNEAAKYWSLVYLNYPELFIQNAGFLTGCNEQSKRGINTDGDDLSKFEEFRNMSDNEKLKALMTHIRVMAQGAYNEFLELTGDPGEALRLTILKMANTIEKNVPVGYGIRNKPGHVLNYENYNNNMPTDQTFAWATGPDSAPMLDCSGFVSAVLYGLGYPSALHDRGNSGRGAANIYNNLSIIEKIDSSSVKIGDLVFWPGLTHVAIVTGIDSHGRISEILHSTSDDSDYDKTFGNTNGLQRTRYPFNKLLNDGRSGFYSRWMNQMRYGRLIYNPYWPIY